MNTPTPKFIFFGTPQLAVIVLDELEKAGLLPSLIVTAPDKPAGRGMQLTPSPVKVWAQRHNIHTIEPESFDETVTQALSDIQADVHIVVAYGKILPQRILDIPPHGTLNVHPSLLPKLRGPSPVRTAILEDHKTLGVSIMLLDEKMDHGPILSQEIYEPEVWPPNAEELDKYLFTRGGVLLAEVLPQYAKGEIEPQEQEHDAATYCRLFTKEDGLLDLNDDPYHNLLKIHAYAGWPGTYFFTEKNGKKMRVKILSAHIENNELILAEVVPEGRGKMLYSEYLKTIDPQQ